MKASQNRTRNRRILNCRINRRAFSRLELLALGGVVALSSAALWPAFAQGGLFDVFVRARENARRASCQSNLKQMGLGALMYMQDYDEKSVPVSASSDASTGYGWAGLLQPYIKSTQIYQCPSERHLLGEAATPAPTSPNYTDYWMNRRVSRLSLAEAESPFQTILFGDGDGGSPNSTARYNLDALPSSWRYNSKSPARRHLQMGNYAFLDGHVKALLPASVTMAPLKQMSKYGATATFSPR